MLTGSMLRHPPVICNKCHRLQLFSAQLGALGYVIKTHAGIELLAALDAVHQGVPFVSRGLSGHVSELSYTQAPNRLHADEVLASPTEAGD
jgi:DNA-binding NarL/FixJ family response regulator